MHSADPPRPPAAFRAAAVRTLNALLAVALAPRCAACRTVLDGPLAGPVCRACWLGIQPVLPPACRRCGQPLPSWRTISVAAERCAACRRRPPAFDAGAVACDYAGEARAIIHAFKYDRRRSLARPLGALLESAGRAVLADADSVVPVPLHPWKRLSRGFNQAADLAATLGPPVRSLLWRVRWTPPQAGLSPAARRRNVSGAFAVPPWIATTARRAHLEGRVLVLVDDVMTTAATLDACARVLKQAGAREVRVLTLARALPHAAGVGPAR